MVALTCYFVFEKRKETSTEIINYAPETIIPSLKTEFSNKFEKNNHKIPKSVGQYKKSVYRDFGYVELYLINPLEFKKPSEKCETDLCKRIISEINNAQKAIDIAIYGMGQQRDIFQALINAKNRGVEIRIIVDLDKNSLNIYPLTQELIDNFNVKADMSSSLMHNKFLIFDNKILLTGSANISSTGTGGYNSNIAIIVKDENIIKQYITEFNQMFEGKFSLAKEKFINNEINKIVPYFSPQDDIYNSLILPEIKNAKKSIYISAFYLTDLNLIEELIKAKARNINVLVLLDATSAMNFKNRVQHLRENNILAIVENWGGKNHEKTIVIDDEKLILGSCNFSKSAFYKNDENVILVNDAEIAKFYSDYYLYLFNLIPKKFLYSIPRAEGLESINSCYDGIDNNFDEKIDSEDVGCKK